MKVNFTLGSFAILVLITACGSNHPGDSDANHGNGDGNSNGVGTTTGGSNGTGDGSGGSSGSGVGNGSGGSNGVTLGEAGSGASNGVGVGEAGAATGGPTAKGTGGSPSDDNGDAGAPVTDDGAGLGGSKGGSGHAGGSNSVGDDDSAGANGNDHQGNANGGSAGLSNGGSAGLSNSGGAGGLSNSGGSGGLPASAGSGAVSIGGSAGGFVTSGGAGGDSNAGSSNSGGSAGLSASAGAGGSGGSGGGDLSLDPQHLFTAETFGGNGRTCTTCHTLETGTINPDQVQALYASNPDDPLFRSIDSDDGVGTDYTQLRTHATFRVSIALPSGVKLASDPTATAVVFRRSAPTTINSPALDPVIMWDGREPSLTSQALDAILGHAEGTVTPTADQLSLIAGFEQGPDFFSNDVLRAYSQGGPEPSWPAGVTDSEQRGRRWFAQDSSAPRFNICGQCHGGPMANTTQSNSGLPAGKRFQTVNVSEFNELGNPTYDFVFPDPNNPGKTVTVTTPDPGRALITGDVRDVNFFKIPSLWGVKNTAPYFHDSSASTLEQLMDHYEKHLATFLPRNVSYPRPHVPTDQDKADIIAYLQLL